MKIRELLPLLVVVAQAAWPKRAPLTGLRWLGLVALLPALASAAEDAGNALEDITFSSLPGDRVEIVLTMSGAAQEPLSFTIDQPARIALDFPDTQVALDQSSRTIGVGAARSITAVQAQDRTRVVVNLVELIPYETRVEDNKIRLLLDSAKAPGMGGEIRSGQAGTADAGGSAKSASGEKRVKNVDFHRTEGGAGRVTVTLTDPSTSVNVQQKGDRLLVDFINTTLPEKLEQRLNVVDFATPVQKLETFARGNDTRMVVYPSGNYDHLAYQSDETFTLEVKPVTEAEREKREEEEYTGERLSLNFQDIEVRSVLQLLADFTGLNMVVSDSVEGNLTLRLKNVPWDQALDIILKSKGLDMRKQGNVITVAPTEELAAREKLELEAQKQIQELAPLRSEFIQVNYAKASAMADLIKAENNSLLSERGNVSIDERTNTLLVQDTAGKLQDIRRLVRKLDVPVRQVLIESRVVVANDDFNKELGVKFGYSQSASHNDKFGLLGGKQPGDTNFGGGTAFTAPNTGNENLIVDLPVDNPAGALGIAIGKVGSALLQLELSALEAEGRGEVVSSPRVITANQKEARIKSGVEIPYQEATSSGATSVSFKEAVLSLGVTPQITPDDRVILDLVVNKDSVGDVFAGVPSIDTREVTTQVLVDNGETVVLGGIYERTRSHQIDRVPFFGELPYVGQLFRTTRDVDEKSELLVFVTPKIVKEKLSTATANR